MNRATEDRQGTPVSTRPAPTRRRASRVGQRVAALAGGLLVAVVLASCAGSPAGTETVAATPSAPDGTGITTQPGNTEPSTTQPGTSGEDATTAAMRQKVTDVLSLLAAATPRPATAQVTDALTAAGIARDALEVSASRTPTGLEADFVDAAVLTGSDCVVGQVRDGSVTVTVLPVLASGKCFVGAAA